jgi:hypothetical protein
MKKLLLSAIALTAILGSIANAATAESKGEFLIGVGQNSNGTKTVTGVGTTTDGTIGYGFTKYWENGVLAGGSLYVGGSGTNEVYYGVDARIGYSYDNVGVYAIGSGIGQSLKGSDFSGTGSSTSYGFGGGAGVEYKWDKFTVAAEYKSYSMSNGTNGSGVASRNYTLTTTNILLKYRF